MIFKIAAKELRAFFLSPLAWTILAIVQFIVALLFLNDLENYHEALPTLATKTNPPGISILVVGQMYASFSVLLLLIVPLVTMRLICDEQRTHTIALLRSAPLSISEIVIGKYFGAMGFLIVLLALVSLMPLSLAILFKLDWGIYFSGMFGLLLLLSSFTAIGLYMSSLTQQPVIAAISTFGTLLLLWIIDIASADGARDSVTHYVSMLSHIQAFLRGIFSSSDIIYYILFSILFLVLTIRRLDALRLQQ